MEVTIHAVSSVMLRPDLSESAIQSLAQITSSIAACTMSALTVDQTSSCAKRSMPMPSPAETRELKYTIGGRRLDVVGVADCSLKILSSNGGGGFV